MDKILSTQQLIDYCKSFPWSRFIKQLHVHHTWKPSHRDYNGKNGLALQASMRDYHMKTNGWADIGQHLTLLPDGQWVTGRDFNSDPASIQGWNFRALAIEMLGNFDKGNDIFGGAQAQAMYEFCAWFCQFESLNIDSDIKFHRDSPTAGKTCPGTSIEKLPFLFEVNRRAMGSELEQTLTKLQAAGVKFDPAYWRANAVTGKACAGQYVAQLLKNITEVLK